MSIVFRRLDVDDERGCFDCGDDDLNDFFLNDSRVAYAQLIAVTYAVEVNNEFVGYFCLSNDSIRKADVENKSRVKRVLQNIPREKRYHTLPAVKIGRLATAKKFQSRGVGTQVLDIIKMWFTEGNKTGCRFIIVDAVNDEKTLAFYKRNGFEFLNIQAVSENDKTRLMFFDLLTFKFQ